MSCESTNRNSKYISRKSHRSVLIYALISPKLFSCKDRVGKGASLANVLGNRQSAYRRLKSSLAEIECHILFTLLDRYVL